MENNKDESVKFNENEGQFLLKLSNESYSSFLFASHFFATSFVTLASNNKFFSLGVLPGVKTKNERHKRTKIYFSFLVILGL